MINDLRDRLQALNDRDLKPPEGAPPVAIAQDAPAGVIPRRCPNHACGSARVTKLEKSKTGQWRCGSCGLEFVPQAEAAPAVKAAEIEPAGVRCPNKACRSRKSRVIDSNLKENATVRSRKRACTICGHEWMTEEK